MNIQGFDISDKVAEDCISSTWKAHQLSLDRAVHIKILNQALVSHPDTLQALLVESKTASQLKSANIVTIYDIGGSSGAYYFVMEAIDGSTVADRINRSGRISVKESLIIAQAITAVMAYVHEQTGFIHRNISPEKIVITSEGTIKIADVGLTASTGVFNEPANYYSPEQIDGKKLTLASDMYSLGCTLYHMLTGKVPFGKHENEEVRNRHKTATLSNPRKIDPKIPAGVVQLLSRLTMKDPAERYSSWTELNEEVKKVAAGRILIQRKGPAGLSTIPAQAATKKTRPKTKPPYQPPAAKNNDGVPMSIQLPAWILLVIWWLILGYIRYPKDPPATRTQTAVRRTIATTTTTIPRKRTVRKKTNPKPKPKSNSIIKTDEEIIAETQAAQKNAADPQKSAADEKIDAIMMNIAYMIYQGDFRTASGLIKNELEYMQPPGVEEKLQSLANFLDKLKPPMKLVEEGFIKKIGLTTTVVYNGVSRKVKIKAVNNQKVVVTPPGGNKPITFSIANLDSTEHARWIPTSTKPEIHAVKHILYMKGTDYESAAKHAEKSGILSDFFTKNVEEKLANQEPEEESASFEELENM